ncbi:MAG: DUF255 domain-containing protein [Bacteroidales bacterium]|nr:DUF255 domain-containing protein [Bacteroidales bacterium]MCF8391595.1 DUF255 domain-containing protein [Bacteroidales bacterium]
MTTIKIISLFTSILVLSGFTIDEKPQAKSTVNSAAVTNAINWLDFTEANKLSATNDKKYFIYVYTDWCSWCKRMNSTSFQDEEVIQLLNDKFISVKFNAESKDPITFRGNEFKFVSSGNRGYHQLAAALLNNKLSYPSIVFLDEKMNMIQPLPGYKSPEDLSRILRYLGDKIYEEMSFDAYLEKTGG